MGASARYLARLPSGALSTASTSASRSDSHHVIHNESKEVLLRMFEHLIAKEQSQVVAIKARRQAKADRKATAAAQRCPTAAASQLKDFLILNLNDNGIN